MFSLSLCPSLLFEFTKNPKVMTIFLLFCFSSAEPYKGKNDDNNKDTENSVNIQLRQTFYFSGDTERLTE